MATARDKASASSPSPLDALERRVAALERERETLMERYARQLEFDNGQLRALLGSDPDVATPPGPPTDTVPSSRAAPDMAATAAAPASAAAMLAHILSGVEGQVDDVERLAAAGELTSAVDTALQVTRRSAAALRATVADAELREDLVTSMTPLDSPPPPSIENYVIAATLDNDLAVATGWARRIIFEVDGDHGGPPWLDNAWSDGLCHPGRATRS